jgi:AraC family transcriptional activator of mtrCDE
VNGQPLQRISRSDLENLMTTLEVSFVKLTECLVSPGWRLALGGIDAYGIHYNMSGSGRMIVGNHPPINLRPHTLVILPRLTPFVLEGPDNLSDEARRSTMQGSQMSFPADALHRFVAGEGEPKLMLICGYFNALYGSSIDLFRALTMPIVEQFDAADQLDQKLKSALAELAAQEVGMRAMATGLLKLVLVALLRRSLASLNVWVERFSMLGDPQIARAFAEMAARPAASHTVQSLSQRVGLSRSAFMARFTAAFDQAPMAVLRQLRLRHAAVLLSSNTLAIDQIAYGVGYKSRSSFSRAFRKMYGRDPSDYRVAVMRPSAPHQEQRAS